MKVLRLVGVTGERGIRDRRDELGVGGTVSFGGGVGGTLMDERRDRARAAGVFFGLAAEVSDVEFSGLEGWAPGMPCRTESMKEVVSGDAVPSWGRVGDG